MIAHVKGRLASKSADRVVVETPGGVGYEVVVPLGVMERLPTAGADITLATELVVREDGWALYGFLTETERRFFQRLTSVTGVGPKLAIALLSALGAVRGARAMQDKNIALLSSVSGIGRKTAERLALELADKVAEFAGGDAAGTGGEPAAALPGGASETAIRALQRLGYAPAEADRALRQALAENGGAGAAGDPEQLVRRALHLLSHG